MPVPNVNVRTNPTNLLVDTTDLVRDKRVTFLTEDVVATGTTLRVQSIIGFESLTTSSGQIICIGEIGNERSEIRRTSQDNPHSTVYNQVELRDSLLFDHPQDTKVSVIDWDRVEFNWAATVNGTKATVNAYPFNITADTPQMVYVDTSATSGYFFARFNNRIRAANSGWSDAIPYGGYDNNSVFSIKQRALDSLGETVDGKVITHEFLNESLWEARREYHESPGKRPFRRKYNFDIGDALTGSFRIELPTDVEKPSSAENIYGVRIGANANMSHYDKKEWDFDFRNKPHTTLTSAYTVGARDLYVASARDFAESGAVSIEGTNIDYSAKSNGGGTLRISADGDWNASAGSDVWQNVSYGLPNKFTVWADPGGSAYVYFNMPIDTAYTGQNIYLDSYQRLQSLNSDNDIVDEPSYDGYVYFLKAKIKERKQRGAFDITQDSDFKRWLQWKSEALTNEYIGVQIIFTPSIAHLDLPN